MCEKITKYTKIEKKLIRNKTKLQFFKYVTLIITLESQKNCLESISSLTNDNYDKLEVYEELSYRCIGKQ